MSKLNDLKNVDKSRIPVQTTNADDSHQMTSLTLLFSDTSRENVGGA